MDANELSVYGECRVIIDKYLTSLKFFTNAVKKGSSSKEDSQSSLVSLLDPIFDTDKELVESIKKGSASSSVILLMYLL